MLRSTTIQKLTAFFLIVVFSCSITPKKSFHDLIATHKDKSKKALYTSLTQVSAGGFNCKCDDLVAESPFVSSFTIDDEDIIARYSPSFLLHEVDFVSVSPLFSSLRGPPVGI